MQIRFLEPFLITEFQRKTQGDIAAFCGRVALALRQCRAKRFLGGPVTAKTVIPNAVLEKVAVVGLTGGRRSGLGLLGGDRRRQEP